MLLATLPGDFIGRKRISLGKSIIHHSFVTVQFLSLKALSLAIICTIVPLEEMNAIVEVPRTSILSRLLLFCPSNLH